MPYPSRVEISRCPILGADTEHWLPCEYIPSLGPPTQANQTHAEIKAKNLVWGVTWKSSTSKHTATSLD